jgi:cytochrome P450
MLPQSLANIGHAAISLKGFMMDIITEESAALNEGKPGSGGLITSLVRALDQRTAKRPDARDNIKEAKRGSLSINEILGNVFVINIAGHDTTANTLAFAMMLLTANPEVQDWLYEEIITVTQGKPVEDWDYALFGQLKRCQAVFLETLRLYAPITGLPKITSKTVQTLQIGDRVLAIPPGTETFPLLLGIQTDPRYWVDPYVWKPSRWILRPETAPEVTEEELFVPQKGTFSYGRKGRRTASGRNSRRLRQLPSWPVCSGPIAYAQRREQARRKSKPGNGLKIVRTM